MGPHRDTARLLYQYDGLFLLWVLVLGASLACGLISPNSKTATSGVNIITDFWILALPIKTLNSTTRPLQEKIALAVIFGVGLFATTMSIVRLQSIYTYTLATDPFRDAIAVSSRCQIFPHHILAKPRLTVSFPQVNLFSQIEINVAILCASVPALKPIFTPHRLQEFRNGRKYQYRPQDKLDSESQRTMFSRKRSHPELYPDSIDLTKMSAFDRSSTASLGGTGKEEVVFNKVWFPPNSKVEDAEDEQTFDMPDQKAFHPV